MPAPKPRYVGFEEGDLAAVNRDGSTGKRVYSYEEKQSWWRQLTFRPNFALGLSK